MAETNLSVSQDQFICSICLDLLKDPVTIPCGHSYCMSCITNCWNQEDQRGVYSCPQCRQTCTTRPDLYKNVVFAELLEKLKTTKLQTDGSELSYAGPEDVECDVCTGRKYKAIKSCLVCLYSYCQTHFECHEELQPGKRHKVIDVTGRLQEMICSQHHKLIEVYCRTDQRCICYLCAMDEHKNHDTVSAAVERTEKRRLLEDKQSKLQQKIQDKEKEIQDLRETVKIHAISAQTAVEDSERIFTELVRSIERSRSEVIQLIRDQEQTAVSQAEELLKKLKQEIDDLRKRNDEMEKLLQTKDHISFLQTTSLSLLSFDDARKFVNKLKEKMEDFCKEKIEMISGKVSYTESTPNEPRTRAEFLQYFHLFSLDQNTTYRRICLSEENRAATVTDTNQPYPDHPDRFDVSNYQLLCSESVSDRCYWESEWGGSNGVGIAVSYKSIGRKGRSPDCLFGLNDQSWSLCCSPSKCSLWHNYIQTDFTVVPRSCRIGVYVDHRAGILSFYSVSDTMTLIHRVYTTFTQPLYPGFEFGKGSTVKLCHLTL